MAFLPPTITRRFEFDAGHRILGHESKCAHLHGHRYVADVTVSGPLDPLGRVIDFGVVKLKIGNWLDENWDHNIILNSNDPLLMALTCLDKYEVTYRDKYETERPMVSSEDITGGKLPYVMPPLLNPTAENMAFVLFDAAYVILMKDQITVEHVRLYETPNCWADYGRLTINPEQRVVVPTM